MFQPKEYVEIPTVDLLTWTFGNDNYDHDKPLFINAREHENSISYNQAKVIVRKLIAGLQANGFRKGDSVCLNSFNNIYYPMIYLAIIGAGGYFVGSNPGYTISELRHLLTISEAKFILTEPGKLKNVQIAVEEAGMNPSNIIIFDTEFTNNIQGFKSWECLLEHGESHWVAFDDEATAKGTTAALLSTSGTTGMPKAAESSHYSQVAQSVMIKEKDKPYEIRRLLFLPQYHAFNAPVALIAPIREGHTTYLMKRYNPHELVQYIEKYKITEITMVNSIGIQLLGLPEEKRRALASLRAVLCGGVPLPASLQKKFKDILHSDAIVSQVYGMTETFWITSLKYPETDDTGSAGRLLPNMEAKIINDEEKELHGDGVQGNIWIRGPSLMLGYLNNSRATEEILVDGWIDTGDIGYQKGGKWYVVDRAKEIIKVRGWQVSPSEIETCLITHPAIIDAAVIGVDFQDNRGELPRAYIVLNPDLASSVTDNEIHDYVRVRLSKYKALDGGIQRRPSIPRNPAGKILKKIFRAEARDEILKERKEVLAVRVAMAAAADAKTSTHKANDSVIVVTKTDVTPITNSDVLLVTNTEVAGVTAASLEQGLLHVIATETDIKPDARTATLTDTDQDLVDVGAASDDLVSDTVTGVNDIVAVFDLSHLRSVEFQACAEDSVDS